MKRIISLLLLFLVLGTADSMAQVIVKDSTVGIYPYFSKKDTLVYCRSNAKYTVNGNDTTFTQADSDSFMVVCKKANDQKGYTLEETYLGYESDSTIFKGSELLAKGKVESELAKCLGQFLVGWKVEFNLNAEGNKWEIANPDKVKKELTEFYSKAMDKFAEKNPLMAKFLPKNYMTELMNSLCSSPEMLLTNFEEMTQLFELHGSGYDLNKEKDTTDNDDPAYTRPSELKLIAVAEPEEGKEVADWDDYSLTIANVEYYDSEKLGLRNLQQLDANITLEQAKQLLGEKMPKGEVQNIEFYENHYFGDGWPKEFNHTKQSVQLDSGEETWEVHLIEWESRSAGNK